MKFLTALFGKAQEKDVFPTENFAVVEGGGGGKPATGSINMAYKNYGLKAKYPWCLRISIGLDLENVYGSGLPKSEERVIADDLEDALLAEIKKRATAHYIGHLYNNTFLDIYIYLDNPKKVHQYLQTQITNDTLTRGFGYEINQDATWTEVEGFLK
ncbi:MAG: DUF695 domain-containing protein [Bacteroidota bacterium]